MVSQLYQSFINLTWAIQFQKGQPDWLKCKETQAECKFPEASMKFHWSTQEKALVSILNEKL